KDNPENSVFTGLYLPPGIVASAPDRERTFRGVAPSRDPAPIPSRATPEPFVAEPVPTRVLRTVAQGTRRGRLFCRRRPVCPIFQGRLGRVRCSAHTMPHGESHFARDKTTWDCREETRRSRRLARHPRSASGNSSLP